MHEREPRLLLVVDHEPTRRALRRGLEDLGCGVIEEASNGTQAIEWLTTRPCDLVITDWQLGDMSGRDFLGWVRKSSRLQLLPVVVCTNVTPKVVADAAGSGVSAFLPQPFLLPTLEELVDRYVGRERSRQRSSRVTNRGDLPTRAAPAAAEAHLLIVDDDPPSRRVLRSVLQRLGFTHVDEAEDGRDALERVRASKYDLVITDWQMPNVSGLELLQAIRRGSERPETPVLVLTGYLTRTRLTEALQEGANGVIGKPFREHVLAEHVWQVLGSHRGASQAGGPAAPGACP